MSRPPLPGDVSAAIRRETERVLSPEAFSAWVDAPWAEDDREDAVALLRWFTRRYPTPAARLEAGRRATLRARALMPGVAGRAR